MPVRGARLEAEELLHHKDWVPATRLLAQTVGMAFIKTPLTFSFSGSAVIVWLGLVVALSVSASLIPAWAATRVRVTVALA